MAPRKDARAKRPAVDSAERRTTASPNKGKAAESGKQQQQPAAADKPSQASKPYCGLHPLVYYLRQYGGLVLAVLGVVGTAYFYDQAEAELMVYKMLAFMCLMVVALAVHETRPFKRMGYGDLAEEQGNSWTSVFGLRSSNSHVGTVQQ